VLLHSNAAQYAAADATTAAVAHASASAVCACLANLLFLQGWSPERAKRFGAALLPAIYEVLPSLRAQ
jgi:hypothetical protein